MSDQPNHAAAAGELIREGERIDDLQLAGLRILQKERSFRFGMDAVLLTGGCSDPLYRRAIRVSMGTVFQVPWAWLEDVSQLRALGFQTVAMALQEDSLSLRDPRLAAAEKLAVVLGTEGEGLADGTIADCDFTVRIPMSHGVDSLNVAAASAVAFWQLGNPDILE